MSAAPSVDVETRGSQVPVAEATASTANDTAWANSLIARFPQATCHFYAADKRTISLVFNEADEVVLNNIVKDMSLKVYSSRTHSEGSKNIRFLGDVPTGALGPKQHPKQKFLPPPSSIAFLTCLKQDIHPSHQPGSARASYVDKDGSGCELRCVKRCFSEHGKILLTFHDGRHNHTCSTFNDHMLPLKKWEMTFVVLGLAKHSTPKEFYEKDLGPLVISRQERKIRRSRFDVLTLPELERIARKMGLANVPRQGAEDIEQVRRFLLARQAEGDTVVYKPPGVSVDHPTVILHADARPFVKTADCLFLIMSRVQREVLAALGLMVATDGTHAVFSYTNVKIIAVTVASFRPGTQLRERGFPVALAITNSEREEIQRAIVITLRNAVPSWQPRLLMTDMAFSAFNAWSAEFPGLLWLWCVFHVWQAWIRRLRNLPNPGGFSKAEWSEIKGHIIRAVKNAVSPKEKNITMSQWEESCLHISKLLWFCRVIEVAECWDLYRARADRWALPKRWECIREIYGELDELPMLARSNNITEAFFNVLKYHILDGKSLRTFIQFLNLWTAYGPRLLSNLARANVLHYIENLMHDAVSPDGDDDEMAALEDELERDEDDLISGVGDKAEEEEEQEQDLPQVFAQNNQALLMKKEDQIDKALDKVIAMASSLKGSREASPRPSEISDSILRAANAAVSLLDAVMHGESQPLDFAPHSQPFVRQEVNFDSTSFETAKARLVADLDGRASAPLRAQQNVGASAPGRTVLGLPPSSGPSIGAVVNTAGSINASRRESRAHLESADMSSLHKKKKVRSIGASDGGDRAATLPEIPFVVFARNLLGNPEAEARITETQHQARGSGIPALRGALAMNTKLRIFSIFQVVLNETLPNKSKAEMIAIALERLASKVQLVPDIAAEVADVGIVHHSSTTLSKGEVVLLKSNSTASTGEACVAPCQTVSGWVIRGTFPVLCDDIDTSTLRWGRLVERRKDLVM